MDLSTKGGLDAAEIDDALDSIETKGGLPPAPQTKAIRPGPATPTEKSAIIAIGKEVLRQGQVIDRLARQPSDPTTLRGAHDLKMRSWGTYQDLLKRERREARRGRPDSLTRRSLARVDGDMDRMHNLERRLSMVEAKRNRPPGLMSHLNSVPGPDGAVRGRSRIDAYLSSPAARLYKQGVAHYLRTGDHSYQGHSIQALGQKAMSTELNPAGGFVVLPEHERSPLMTFLRELSPMRQIATVLQTTTNELVTPTILSTSEAEWAQERVATGETDTPTLGEDRTPVHEMRANPRVTQILLDDAFVDLEAFLTQEVGTRFAELESESFITGSSITRPRGLLTYTFVADHSLWAHGAFRLIETGVSGGFHPTAPTGSPPTMPDDVLIDVITSVKAANRVGASWLMNRKSVGSVRKLRDVDGRPLWQPSAIAGQPDQLSGFPVDEDEFMPDIGLDTIAIGFGNWKKTYRIVDRIGVTVLRDPYTVEGQIVFKTRKRVGGGVQYFDAACFLRFSA